MTTAITISNQTSTALTYGGAEVDEEVARWIGQLLADKRAPSTLRAYRSALASFAMWCRARGVAVPATHETIVLWIAERSRDGLSTSQITKTLAAIRAAWKASGSDEPCDANHPAVKRAVDGLRVERAAEEPKRATALTPAHVVAMVGTCDLKTRRGIRDRAAILLAFFSAMRRSELAALDWPDLDIRPEGAIVTVHRHKTSRRGKKRRPEIGREGGPLCPVAALEAWRSVSASTGPVFREVNALDECTDRRSAGVTISRILQRAAKRIGLEGVSGHSTRRGFITTAVRQGRDERGIRKQSGHSVNSRVFEDYVEEGRALTTGRTAGLLEEE